MKVSILFSLCVGFSFLLFSDLLIAADKLIIISPHRKSLQEETVRPFKEWYKKTYKTEVEVDWLDQGGTSDNLRFVRTKLTNNAKSAGIDIFWGGGSSAFSDLDRMKALVPYKLSAAQLKELPETAAGVRIRSKNFTWMATAVSSFGIFYNKRLLKMYKLEEPVKWDVLAEAQYYDKVTMTDPRRSGTASLMNIIILDSFGWEKGWSVLTQMSANAKKFSNSSSDPLKDVVSGAAVATPSIDFYAYAQIAELGEKNVGFILPEGQTVLDPDPIGILKGAPNLKVAQRFVDYALSVEAQKVLLLPKGSPGGPTMSFLGRMSINTKAYEETKGKTTIANPFEQKTLRQSDYEKDTKLTRPLNDLVGTLLIDSHRPLRKAWSKVLKDGADPELVKEIGTVPVTEAETLKLDDNWEDSLFRNKEINRWTKFANDKYKKISSKKKKK